MPFKIKWKSSLPPKLHTQVPLDLYVLCSHNLIDSTTYNNSCNKQK